jgi:hypothetical protein
VKEGGDIYDTDVRDLVEGEKIRSEARWDKMGDLMASFNGRRCSSCSCSFRDGKRTTRMALFCGLVSPRWPIRHHGRWA